MGEVKKYRVNLEFEYEILTDDIERTKRVYEFPTFPDLMEDEQVEFIMGGESWDDMDIYTVKETD
jgi:hypothetical protein